MTTYLIDEIYVAHVFLLSIGIGIKENPQFMNTALSYGK